ncbi:MAG: Asp-tRNA(Asn)/Glu-tRNA(Gln) amidotransferase subunit GatA [Alphaproteobacteria bacterium]|nr:Asp-tRNA(Asn)/Glu-tRNA(Gln) amidotransferase subunit GatA [Alphaproteobacteria bacterium]
MNREWYQKANIVDMRKALDGGTVSVKQLVQWAKEIIEEKNKSINAFIEVWDVNEDEIAQAQQLIDQKKSFILTGIPYAIKDNISYKGKHITASSKILATYIASYDATVVVKIKKQHALCIGRLNCDEFAMGSGTENSIFGPTKNPADTTRVAGGSSGGSAAAVAIGAVPFALGSDTGGSIRQPASYCGVVGLKPAYGTVSRYGLIALGSSLDVIGPCTKTVEDAFIVMEVISGEDSFDMTTKNARAKKSAVMGKKLLEPKNIKELVSPEVWDQYSATKEKLKKEGYYIDEIDISLFTHGLAMYYIIQPAEASSNLARMDGMRFGVRKEGEGGLWSDYLESRKVGLGHEVKKRIVLGTYVLSAGHYDAYYGKADALRSSFIDEVNLLTESYDALICPTTCDVAFKIGLTRNLIEVYNEDKLTVQANLLGSAAISVPMGSINNLPVGIQIMTSPNRADSNTILKTIAEVVEKIRA